jgi:hypothetical protein
MLGKLTKMVLETALEAEMTAHLGYEAHDPAGRNGGNTAGRRSRPHPDRSPPAAAARAPTGSHRSRRPAAATQPARRFLRHPRVPQHQLTNRSPRGREASHDADRFPSRHPSAIRQVNIRTTLWPPRRGSRDGGRPARPAGMSTEAIRGAFCAAAVRMSARTPPAGSPPRRHGRWWPTDAGGTRDPCSDR